MKTPRLHDRLAAAWPTDQWQDVHAVVAVSGGPDSLALLRLLLEQKGSHAGNGRLYVGHVNHLLRGEEAQADQQWLAEQCRKLDVPLIARSANPRERAADDGDGIEAAARIERYRVLTQIAESVGARYVAVGHHADDQLETVLMRLFRGAGLRGLRGMPPRRPLSRSVTLVRPMLAVTRDELLAYLKSMGQPFRPDPTNLDVQIDRNRLRHELLPMIRSNFRGDPATTICRTTEQLAAAQAVIDSQASELAVKCGFRSTPSSTIELTTTPLKAVSRFLAIETLRFVWRLAEFPEQAMTYEHWNRLYNVVRTDIARESLPGKVVATVDDGRLVLVRPTQ